MDSSIVVHPDFDRTWPFAADHFHNLWKKQGEVFFLRLDHNDNRRLGEIIPEPGSVKRLVSLNVPVTLDCLKRLENLEEAVFQPGILEEAVFQPGIEDELREYADKAGIKQYRHTSVGFWGQSVSEFALALTLCGLRRIPQLHHEIITSHEPWNYRSKEGKPGSRGAQFGDDPDFVNGTARGKNVRIVGVGNIGSRYASFMNMLGADVAAWDPFASDPCFHRAGARKEWHLDALVKDADIFAPMLPLLNSTRGLVTAEHIHALPKGCLVVLVTRARICDVDAIRKRVLADEITLAADVFDIEPLPLDDPLLGRRNVVHTPHNAGRTEDANKQWAEHLAVQFQPR